MSNRTKTPSTVILLIFLVALFKGLKIIWYIRVKLKLIIPGYFCGSVVTHLTEATSLRFTETVDMWFWLMG